MSKTPEEDAIQEPTKDEQPTAQLREPTNEPRATEPPSNTESLREPTNEG